jgi:hypothetical protein
VSSGLAWVLPNYVPDTANLLNKGGFQTFCLEAGEHFTPGHTYVGVLNTAAIFGGPGASGGSDPISLGTAWLYSQFAAGSLNYNYTLGSSRTSSATTLQQAIWWLEGENFGVRNDYVTAAADALMALHYIDVAEDVTKDANGAFGVRVINVWDAGFVGAHGHEHQDWLVVVPEPTTIIAGALLLLPFGVQGVRCLRKHQFAN